MPTAVVALLALTVACGAPQGRTAPATIDVQSSTDSSSASSGAPVVVPSAVGDGGATLPRTAERIWTFDTDPADAAPTGFSFAQTGKGSPGRWIVTRDPTAPSGPMVLAQLDAEPTLERCPIAVEKPLSVRDVHLSVRCRILSGRLEQACGLVARYRDPNNYFVTRASALDNDVSLSIVQDGQVQKLARWQGEVTSKVWHSYRFEVRGLHLEVFWDGEEVIDYHGAFTDAGRVGVWTQADSVAYFDDLRAEHF